MRSLWIIIAVCSLSNCAFVDGLHNQQNNTSEKLNAQGEALPSLVTMPEPIKNQSNPTTHTAKVYTP